MRFLCSEKWLFSHFGRFLHLVFLSFPITRKALGTYFQTIFFYKLIWLLLIRKKISNPHFFQFTKFSKASSGKRNPVFFSNLISCSKSHLIFVLAEKVKSDLNFPLLSKTQKKRTTKNRAYTIFVFLCFHMHLTTTRREHTQRAHNQIIYQNRKSMPQIQAFSLSINFQRFSVFIWFTRIWYSYRAF